MAAFTKFNNFVLNLGDAKFNFSSDALKIMLANVLPVAATAQTTSDITEIAPGNGYTAGGNAVGSLTWAQSGGTATLAGNEVDFTATGGSIATFRYGVLYDSTTTYLVGFWDTGAAQTITSGNTYGFQFNGVSTAGTILTVT